MRLCGGDVGVGGGGGDVAGGHSEVDHVDDLLSGGVHRHLHLVMAGLTHCRQLAAGGKNDAPGHPEVSLV